MIGRQVTGSLKKSYTIEALQAGKEYKDICVPFESTKMSL